MKEWIRKNKNGIVIGVVSSLLTAIVIRAFHFLLSAAPSAGNSLFSKLRDYIYYQAGRQSSYSLVFTLFSLAFGLFFSYTFIILIKALRSVQTAIDIENVSDLLDGLEKKNTDDPEFKSSLEKAKRINKRLKRTNNKKSTMNTPKMAKTILIVCAIFFLSFFCYVYTYELLPATMWHNFELSIAQITPYVSDEKVDLLRSQWVSMNSSDDYIEIKNYIESVKVENDLH